MFKTRSMKFAISCLIALAVIILPTAFSVSYAKWTGGINSIPSDVNIGTWTDASTDLPYPDRPLTEFPTGFTSGILAMDENGNPVDLTESGKFSWQATGGTYGTAGGTINIKGFDDKPIYIQIFRSLENNAKEAVNFPLSAFSSSSVEHSIGSYWYKLPHNGAYEIRIDKESGSDDVTVLISLLDKK